MQTQDASAEIMFKFWPWYEANQKRLIIAASALVVAWVVWFFLSTQRQQAELAAGQAYTQFQLNQPTTATPQQVADGYSKIATQYAGTLAGQRAHLQAGAALFGGGLYAEALAQFQKFLTAESGSSLARLAQSGVAACLESQGKLDEALAAYRKVATSYPDSNEAIAAKFAQGRVLELQGKLSEAISSYQEAAQAPLAGSLASEAAQRIALIQVKLPVVKPAAKS